MSALVRAAVMVGVFVSVASWSGRAAAQGPTAAFTFTVTGDTVFLTDTSTGPAAITSWTWMFGDGGGSIAQNPIHDYCTSIGQCSSGPHTVTLTVSDGNGRSDTVSMLITLETPGASYTTDISGLTVVFTDTSTPGASAITSWLWDFGDGGTSTQQNPTHTYATGGMYTVCLTPVNDQGASASCGQVTVASPPVAAFTHQVNDLTVALTDTSTAANGANVVAWAWDFGDGNTSTQQNPSHTYSAGGTYTVTLTVTASAGGTDTVSSMITVSAPAPTCSITAPAMSSTVSSLATLIVDADQFGSGTVALLFEWSTDGGSTFHAATAATGSPTSNPATGITTPATNVSFAWDLVADAVAPSTATAAIVRVTVTGASTGTCALNSLTVDPARCGDGVVAGSEVCDDDNNTDGDGCSANCLSDETCGNGVLDAASEVCDDDNNTDGDGCSADCLSDETCGNGMLDTSVGEACDDENTTDGDGCQADCALPVCGDGVLDTGEGCDDDNEANGDGCSSDCTIETSGGGGCSVGSPRDHSVLWLLLACAAWFTRRRARAAVPKG
ncbi:MAG: PKD domain-containing protein [Sandaracinaceae bacterium]|nr:PKD domain-containing protein [Myxococcales bacterium]MCB9661362.1 PKD domain-containing protein [Sandaracinaceae bacterium]